MSVDPRHYTYQVAWSPEDEEYVGTCLEFPSLSWLGKSTRSALTGITHRWLSRPRRPLDLEIRG